MILHKEICRNQKSVTTCKKSFQKRIIQNWNQSKNRTNILYRYNVFIDVLFLLRSTFNCHRWWHWLCIVAASLSVFFVGSPVEKCEVVVFEPHCVGLLILPGSLLLRVLPCCSSMNLFICFKCFPPTLLHSCQSIILSTSANSRINQQQ